MPSYTVSRGAEQWGSHDAFLDEYHEAVVDNTTYTIPSPKPSKGPSVHRPSSIITDPHNSRSSFDTLRSDNTTPKARRPWANGRTSSVTSSLSDLKRRRTRRKESLDTTSSSSPILPDVHYFQDPDTRDLLKTYLTSATKFDEVVEFGFPTDINNSPSEEFPQRMTATRRKPHNANNDAELFLRDGSIPFLSDLEESDEESDPEEVNSTASPTLSSLSSMDVGPQSATLNFKPWDMGFGGGPGERQMTLRVTLTRPELRASDKDIYGAQYAAHHEHNEPEEWDEAEEATSTDLLALPRLQEFEEGLINLPLSPPAPSGTESRKGKSLWRRMSRAGMGTRVR